MRLVRARLVLTAFMTTTLGVAGSLTPGCDCAEPIADDDDDDDTGEGEGEGEEGEGEGEGDAECTIDIDCNDDDACTADRCSGGQCEHPDSLDGTPCGEDPCTGGAACVSGVCTEGVPPDLDADNDGAFTQLCFGTDCDDNDASVFPGANEGATGASDATCTDGKDNDCDGAADSLELACGATDVCDDGWCWENPRPHGFPLSAVWPSSADDVWVGGQQGGAMHLAGGANDPEVTIVEPFVQGFPASFAKMWGASENDVWAAGGIMLHWDGVEWREDLATFGVGGSLIDVWGLASDDVWAVGFSRAVHYDGVAWSTFDLAPLGVQQLQAVHGVATDDIWAVGNATNGTGSIAAHWDGEEWTVEPVATGQFALLLGVLALGPDDVWATGDIGLMWHRDASGTWTSFAAAPNRRMAGIFGTASDDIWASGDQGTITHWNGTSWGIAAQIPGVGALSGMRGRAADDIWTVGFGAAMVHYDGDAWSRINVPARPLDGTLTDVATVGGEAWAVGVNGSNGPSIGRRDSEGIWQAEPQNFAGSTFSSVVAVDVDDVWALGSGPAWHYDGTTWNQVPIPNGSNFSFVNDACAVSATELYAVSIDSFADTGRVLVGDGTSWTVDAVLPGRDNDPPDVQKVFCTGPGEVWAGGQGTLFQRNPVDGEWVRLGTSTLADGGNIFRTFAADANNVWVATTNGVFSSPGTVARFDGQEWREVTVPEIVGEDPTGHIFDVHGTSANDVWLVGENNDVGMAYHWDGSALTKITLPLIGGGGLEPFQFVFALGPDDVMFVSPDLTTYRWDGSALTRIVEDPSSGDISSVFFTSPTNGWATSATFGSTIHHWDGTTWTTDFQFAISEGTAIWGFADDDIWVVGDRMEVAHFDGTEWTGFELVDSFSDQLTDVWGSGPNDVWATGSDGSLWHNPGPGFAQVLFDQALDRKAVRGVSDDDIFVISLPDNNNDGLAIVERGDGNTFTRYRSLEHPAQIQRVGDRVLAIDMLGGVWERTASGWDVIVDAETDLDDIFLGVTEAHFVDEDDAWTMGFFGLRHFIGGGFVQSPIPLAFPVQALGGSGADLYAVGGGGTVLHRAQ